MTTQTSSPLLLQSPSGLSVQVNANGSIRRMDHGDIILNLFLGSEIEGGPANLYLRRHGQSIESVPLLGPRSPAAVQRDEHGLSAAGQWQGIRFTVTLALAQAAPAWFWHIALANTGDSAATVDLIYAQDLALAHYGLVRLNEYYVSQYVDHTPLAHPGCGTVLAVRQNLPMEERHPWAVLGALGQGVGFATDALQFHGLATRAGAAPVGLSGATLPGRRRQHEHSMAVIQDAALLLAPGAEVRRGFFGGFREHHPAATSDEDLAWVDQVLALPEAQPPARQRETPAGVPPAATLFSARPLLAGLDLTETEAADLFGPEWRQVERENGILLSFFTDTDQHVVLKAKELNVLRPHGHLIRTGHGLTPDEASLTSTTWMAGVFNSLLTQGHVSINRLLSTTRGYLGLLRSNGQRIFVELTDGYHLLDVPSAYAMTPNGCRWLYKHRDGLIQVRGSAYGERHRLNLTVEVLAGPPCRFLISNHIAIDGDDGAAAVPVRFTRDPAGITIHPSAEVESDVGSRFPDGYFRIEADGGTVLEQVGGDELLFTDGRSRRQPFLILITAPALSIGFRITGHLLPADGGADPEPAAAAPAFWQDLLGSVSLQPDGASPLAGEVARLAEILPWLAHNALIHYLAPRGLEQYSGGGWGTRDVCQGPVEMLLALGCWEPLRDLLLRVFKAQNPDGDWPQWFMFFDRERAIRPQESHGDIVFWPLLALAQYLAASRDATILDTVVPFFHPEGDAQAEQATVWDHVERALGVIAGRLIPGAWLAAYGNGDWDDSLQPVDPTLRERLCSAWTVTLHYQTLAALADACRRLGRTEPAAAFAEAAAYIQADFQRLLISDATLAGFALFQADQRIDYLLHPGDRITGIRYRLLPMIHALINGLLTPDQAAAHIGYIRRHLLGPDGARLADRPTPYRGGSQRYFQRAESSAFFGREIGLMYMHAHLRYAEAMARYGDADGFFLALRQANPIALRALVPTAALRQANCYYSSSDATFADRYEAAARYRDVNAGRVALEGGWRVYSSGAGIMLSLIYRCLLGLRRGKSVLVIDPVIPGALDGLRARLDLVDGKPVEVIYRVGAAGYGPTALILNGAALDFERQDNPYRTGGAAVSMAALTPLLNDDGNELIVQLG